MHQVDIQGLEKKIASLSDALANLDSGQELRELLLLVRKPGWTTPAEAAFVHGLLDAMHAHAELLVQMKHALLRASKAVR